MNFILSDFSRQVAANTGSTVYKHTQKRQDTTIYPHYQDNNNGHVKNSYTLI